MKIITRRTVTVAMILSLLTVTLFGCSPKSAADTAPAADAVASDATTSDAATSDAATPETSTTETDTPDAVTSDTDDSDTDDSDADTSDTDDSDVPEYSTDEEYDGPSNFLEEQAGRTDFKDFDEIISYMHPGQGYAKFKLVGLDDDVLAISDDIDEKDDTASHASIYRIKEGQAIYMSDAGGIYDGYHPLRLEDGILYCGDDHTYDSEFISASTGGLMLKDSVLEDDEEGTVKYIGFLRDNNDFGADKDFTGGKEEFEKMIKERDSKPVIKFTVIQ